MGAPVFLKISTPEVPFYPAYQEPQMSLNGGAMPFSAGWDGANEPGTESNAPLGNRACHLLRLIVRIRFCHG